MKVFILTARFVERNFPLLWEHSSKANRRIMVYYYLPGMQSRMTWPKFAKLENGMS